jgi:ABC-2 type transport system permease protein
MIGVLTSEWLKLRSIRSTYYLLGVAAAGVLLAALLAWDGARLWDSLSPARRAHMAPISVEQTILPLVQLCLAVLGVLAITSEYATGMIRTSLVVVPRRLALLAAKAPVVAAIALVAGEVVMFAMFFVSRLIIGARLIPGNMAPVSSEVRVLLAAGLSVPVFALVGVGLGTVLRSTAGALVAVVVLLFVLPTFAHFLPPPWDDRAGSAMLPSLAGQLAGAGTGEGVAAAFVGGSPGGNALLSPLGALLVMAAYVAAALVPGAVTISRRDA